MIGEDLKARMREVVARYPQARSAMLPCLHLAQEAEGYITPAGILAVAEVIGAKPDEVESVVTFYSMYTQKPLGRYIIKVCTSISCYLQGCDDLLAHIERQLDIRRGETTPDRRFTLQAVECLAACGMAPALQVNGEFVELATADTADRLIAFLRSRDDLRPGDIRNEWRQISDGRGMATETRIGVGNTGETGETAGTNGAQTSGKGGR
ncbi:MAG: NAD(P)H-dependent oxidoreductase subunit E [Ktedonobacterales bacterium]